MINRFKTYLRQGETTPYLLKTFFMYGLIALSIIATKVLIARLYGQEELGQFSYFFSLVTVAFLFTSFGLPEAITQLVVQHHSQLRTITKKAIIRIAIISAIIIIPFVITNFFLQDTISKINFVFYIVTYTFFYLFYCIFRAYKEFVKGTWYSLVNRLVFILIIIGCAIFSVSFKYVLTGLSLALLTASLVSLPSFWRLWKESKDLSPERENIATKEEAVSPHTLWNTALALALMQAGFYLLRETDILIIPYLVDYAQLGLYSAHSSLSNIIRLIAYVFPVVVLPMAVVSKYKISQSFQKIIKILIPFSLLVLAATYFFVPVLYGQEYTNYSLPILLVLSSALMVIYSYFNSVLVGENKVSSNSLRLVTIDFLITIFVNTGLTLLFVYWWGIIGAPVATTLTLLLKIGLNLYGIQKLRRKNGEENTTLSDGSSPPSPDRKSQSH